VLSVIDVKNIHLQIKKHKTCFTRESRMLRASLPSSGRLSVSWALEAFKSWGSKQCPGPWRARGARAYNEGLGAEPLAGSRGRASGGGSGGQSPPEAESFLVLERPTERQNFKMSKSIRLSLTSQCKRLKLLGEQELWPALPCQKLGEQLLPLLPLFQRP